MTGYMYAFSMTVQNRQKIKVGWSSKLPSRMKQYKSQFGVMPEIFLVCISERAFEKEVHRQLSKWALHGEWYSDTEDCRIAIVDAFQVAGKFVAPSVDQSEVAQVARKWCLEITGRTTEADWPDDSEVAWAVIWKHAYRPSEPSIDEWAALCRATHRWFEREAAKLNGFAEEAFERIAEYESSFVLAEHYRKRISELQRQLEAAKAVIGPDDPALAQAKALVSARYEFHKESPSEDRAEASSKGD